jgi:hypothetical protein
VSGSLQCRLVSNIKVLLHPQAAENGDLQWHAATVCSIRNTHRHTAHQGMPRAAMRCQTEVKHAQADVLQ